MSEELNIIWYDDQKKVFDNTIPTLTDEFKENYDLKLKFNGFIDYNKFSDTLNSSKKLFDIVFLDIDLNDDSRDGIDVYEEIRRKNTKIIAVFISAHLHDLNFEDRIERLQQKDDKLFTIKLGFPPRMIREDFYKAVSLPMLHVIDAKFNIYENSYDDFILADSDSRVKMLENVSRFDAPFVESYFQRNHSSDWIVMGERPGAILKTGEKGTVLTCQELMEISEENGIMVTGFQRDKKGVIKVTDNPVVKDYVYQKTALSIDTFYGKILEVESEGVTIKCRSASDVEHIEVRKYTKDPFINIMELKENKLVEIKIITYPGEVKYVFKEAPESKRFYFEKRKYFNSGNYDDFFKSTD